MRGEGGGLGLKRLFSNRIVQSVLQTLYIHILCHFQLGHRYLNATNSWEEQRNFTNLALEALGNHTLANSIRMNLKALQPQKPDFTGR